MRVPYLHKKKEEKDLKQAKSRFEREPIYNLTILFKEKIPFCSFLLFLFIVFVCLFIFIFCSISYR